MDLTTREDGRVTILTVNGDLVIGEAESAFKKTVTRLLEEGRVHLLVDLSKGTGGGAAFKTLARRRDFPGKLVAMIRRQSDSLGAMMTPRLASDPLQGGHHDIGHVRCAGQRPDGKHSCC